MKDIHIGQIIHRIVTVKQIEIEKILKSFETFSEDEIQKMYDSKSLDSAVLLQWCKLCAYNFLLIYHEHLQIYAPIAAAAKIKLPSKKDAEIEKLHFNKSVYSNEVKEFILELIETKEMSVAAVISNYQIPKTTVYKWLKKKNSTHPCVARSDYHFETTPNYSKLYMDIASYYDITLQPQMVHKINNINKTVDVLQINKAIFESSYFSLGQANAYQMADVMHILTYKRKNKLNLSQTANHFKMSRNTLTRWERVYGQAVQDVYLETK